MGISARLLRALLFSVLFIVGFLVGTSELVLLWVSSYFRISIPFGGYPLALFLAIFLTFLVGALIKKRMGCGLIVGTATDTIFFLLLLSFLLPYILIGGD